MISWAGGDLRDFIESRSVDMDQQQTTKLNLIMRNHPDNTFTISVLLFFSSSEQSQLENTTS